MKALSEILLPAAVQYSKEHIWMRKDGNDWLVGVSDYAQDQLGEVVFVELPAVGDRVAAGSSFGTVESVKSVSTLFMPVDGDIVAINSELEALPSLINADCYTQGWIVRIKSETTPELLTADAYRYFLEQ